MLACGLQAISPRSFYLITHFFRMHQHSLLLNASADTEWLEAITAA